MDWHLASLYLLLVDGLALGVVVYLLPVDGLALGVVDTVLQALGEGGGQRTRLSAMSMCKRVSPHLRVRAAPTYTVKR